MALPPLRPGLTPPLPAKTTPAGGARSAAQRAFFDAALSKAGAVTQAQPVARVQTAAIQPGVTRLRGETLQPQPQDEPASRILRPGSLLDIKV